MKIIHVKVGNTCWLELLDFSALNSSWLDPESFRNQERLDIGQTE